MEVRICQPFALLTLHSCKFFEKMKPHNSRNAQPFGLLLHTCNKGFSDQMEQRIETAPRGAPRVGLPNECGLGLLLQNELAKLSNAMKHYL